MASFFVCGRVLCGRALCGRFCMLKIKMQKLCVQRHFPSTIIHKIHTEIHQIFSTAGCHLNIPHAPGIQVPLTPGLATRFAWHADQGLCGEQGLSASGSK